MGIERLFLFCLVWFGLVLLSVPPPPVCLGAYPHWLIAHGPSGAPSVTALAVIDFSPALYQISSDLRTAVTAQLTGNSQLHIPIIDFNDWVKSKMFMSSHKASSLERLPC